MRILFGFGNTQLPQTEVRDVFAKGVLQAFRRERDRHTEALLVLRQADECGKLRSDLTLEAVKIRLDKGTRDLACAVRAVIHRNDDIAILHVNRLFTIRDNGRGLYEFVGFFAGIGHLEGRDGVGGPVLRLAERHEIIGRLDTLPAMIAVHGVKTADDADDAATACFPENLLDLF